jgi:hypothetical protein
MRDRFVPRIHFFLSQLKSKAITSSQQICRTHLGHPVNRAALAALSSSRDDWLVLASDVSETEAHLDGGLSFGILTLGRHRVGACSENRVL